jgi:hypothetical protein
MTDAASASALRWRSSSNPSDRSESRWSVHRFLRSLPKLPREKHAWLEMPGTRAITRMSRSDRNCNISQANNRCGRGQAPRSVKQTLNETAG